MKLRFRLIFVVFFMTAVLIFTAHIRTVNSDCFYRLCKCLVEQGRLKQQLGNKQLRLESVMNPAHISQILNANDEPD